MLQRSERLHQANPSAAGGRTEFQRDRDRILYSGHFRRLGGITQVTTPSELHSFHNRLTHTLEVAQIARRIAERFSGHENLDPDVCEAAALAHDLGHPPFGHNGENVLDQLARDPDLDFHISSRAADGYEGNAQSLRIVLKLAVRNGTEPGLNLTSATLRAIIKYPWLDGQNPNKPTKFGVFDTEETEFALIWDGLPAQEQTLEAQIMDWADDVAYSTHDFYDFALAGLIPLELLKGLTADSLRTLLNSQKSVGTVSEQAWETVSAAFRTLPQPPLLSTSRLNSTEVGMLKDWVSMQIGRFAAEYIDVRSGKLETKGSVSDEVAILKALTYHYAIASPALAIRQESEKRVLTSLYTILEKSAQGDGKLLSESAKEELSRGTNTARVILDVLSSMTDAQATSIYHKLMGFSPISILDTTTTSVF